MQPRPNLALAVFLALTPAGAIAQPIPPELQPIGLLGPAAGDNFGKSVAILGDINGDGHPDVAVGAPYSDIAASNAGAVFIYLGGPGGVVSTTRHLILTGQAADDQFGFSLAGGMDLNGDGFPDLAVGARFNDLGGGGAGAVFIYYGGPCMTATPSLVLVGEAGDDWFGQSVASAGDVNGDGFADVIVGAPYNDEAANAAGKAYIFYGGPAMNAQPDVHLLGAAASNSHFGWSVSGAGDVNGDGFDDVIVGARLHGSGPFRARGRAYIFHGGSAPSATPALIIEGEFPQDWFGEAVGGGGDMNGDGFDDVIVGAIYADPNGLASGKAYIYFGGSPMDAVADLTLAGPEADAQLGNAVRICGSINDDTFADALIGARFANATSGLNAGKAFVLNGGAVPSNQPSFVIPGQISDEQLGEGVAGTPTAAAGPNMFIVGVHYNNENGVGAGKAYVLSLGGGNAPCPADWNDDGIVNSNDISAFISTWLASVQSGGLAADFNGDGLVNSNDISAFLSAWLVAVVQGCP